MLKHPHRGLPPATFARLVPTFSFMRRRYPCVAAGRNLSGKSSRWGVTLECNLAGQSSRRFASRQHSKMALEDTSLRRYSRWHAYISSSVCPDYQHLRDVEHSQISFAPCQRVFEFKLFGMQWSLPKGKQSRPPGVLIKENHKAAPNRAQVHLIHGDHRRW